MQVEHMRYCCSTSSSCFHDCTAFSGMHSAVLGSQPNHSHKCYYHKPVHVLQAVAKACLASGWVLELGVGAFQVGKITFGKLREIEGASGSTAESEAKAAATEAPAEEIADEKAHIAEAPSKAAKVQHSLSH